VGWTTGRGAGANAAGEKPATAAAADAPLVAGAGADVNDGAVTEGSLRTDAGRSGRGASSDTCMRRSRSESPAAVARMVVVMQVV